MAAMMTETTTTRKPTAYYAQYLGLAGVLTRPAGGCSSWSPTVAPWAR